MVLVEKIHPLCFETERVDFYLSFIKRTIWRKIEVDPIIIREPTAKHKPITDPSKHSLVGFNKLLLHDIKFGSLIILFAILKINL